MKASEMQRCALCGEGVMWQGLPVFWRLTVQRMGVDLAAVRQVAGLEMLIGNVAIARALGPDPDIARPLGEERSIVVCEGCAAQETSIYQLGLPEEG